MATKFIHHTVALAEDDPSPNKKYFFKAPTNAYLDDDIKTATGIVQSIDDHQDEPICTVGELLLSGVCARVKFTYTKSGKKLVGELLCSRSKIQTVSAGLIGKGYNGGTITGIHAPRRRVKR